VKRFLRALLGVAVMTVAAASTQAADDWINLATVSMTNATTPKLTNRYVCYSDGVDVACNAPSLYVTTGGLVGIGTDGPQATSYNLDTNTNDATSLDVSTSVRTDGAGYYIGHEENHPAKQGGAHFSYDYANNKIYLSGIKQGKWLIREV
jgi:hypothetical protein